MMRVTVSPSTTEARIFSTSSTAGRLAEQQRLGLGGENDRDHDQEDADAQGADAVPDAVPGAQRQADASEGQDQADERAQVLEEDDREFRCLGPTDELRPGQLAPGLVGLGDGRTEGEALGDDREDQHADRPVPGLDLVGVLDLLVALVDGEHATDGEQHDGDEEGVDVALAPVSEGVLRGRLALGLLAAEQQETLVAGVRQRVDALRQHR